MSHNAHSRRTGILCNPNSGRVRKKYPLFRNIIKQAGDVNYQEVTSKAEIHDAINQFAVNDINYLIIISGDGTFHEVLTTLFTRNFFDQLPVLSLVPGGTTNMTAYDFGFRGKPEKILTQLIKSFESEKALQHRHVLRIEEQDNITRYGMFFGTGIIADGVRYFRDRLQSFGVTGESVSGLVIARYLASLLFSKTAAERSVISLRMSQNNSEFGEEQKFMTLFTTVLQRLLLGTRPYWGMENSPVHMTSVRQSPSRLWRSLPYIFSGNGAKLSQNDDYLSRNLDSLSLLFDDEYVIDGEIYRKINSDNAVKISAMDKISLHIP